MSLEELSNENIPTQQEISNRLRTIGESVHQYLVSNGINFGYDSETNTFQNWYGRTIHVNYDAKLGFHVGSGKLHSRQININVLRGTKLVPPRLLTDEEVVDTLLHEKIHHDIGIIETPLACLGIVTFGTITRNFFGTAGLLAGYLLLREFLVGGIKRFKYERIKIPVEEK